MIFDESGKIDADILLNWKYYGICIDEGGKEWAFYTNSVRQYRDFRKKKELFGMKLKYININNNLEVIRKIIGDANDED